MQKIDLLDTDATAAALRQGTCTRHEVMWYVGLVGLLSILRLEIPLPRPIFGGALTLWQLVSDVDPGAKLQEYLQDPYNVTQLQYAAIKIGLFLACQGVALGLAYRANRQGDGRDFWWRALALAGPAGVVTLIPALAVFVMVYQPVAKAIMEQQHWGMFGPAGDNYVSWHALLFILPMEAYFIHRLRRGMAEAAGARPLVAVSHD